MLTVHDCLEILMLKSSPGPLGVNEIQETPFPHAISDLRRLQALLGLWQDSGAIQRGHLVRRPVLGEEVVDLKPGQIFQGMLLRLRDRNCSRGFLHPASYFGLVQKAKGMLIAT